MDNLNVRLVTALLTFIKNRAMIKVRMMAVQTLTCFCFTKNTQIMYLGIEGKIIE